MKTESMGAVRKFLVVLLTISSLLAGGAAQAQPFASQITIHTCAKGYYKNSKGVCAKSSTKAPAWPAGASAKCRDGSYSFSQSRRGTCSHHGGVAVWGN